ncbi:unnamed protein product [Mytilus coruscus]|uniref:Uncharacterized protein n=1 Tax=Mytilus coruscus TaxID=42192 RepID=A0A6J7ZYH4_MYTCO|nr:unnamed protein product [Mytilus coruscus]
MILVLQDKVEHQGYKVISIQDYLVIEATQQKLKLQELQAKFSTINDDNSEIRRMILSLDESNKNRVKSIDDTFAELRRSLLPFQNKAKTNGVNIETIKKYETQTETKIRDMKTENMKQIQDIKDTIARLHSDQNGVKDDLEEIKENLKKTFGNIFDETKEVYKVTEHIHERINKLDVIVNRPYDTNIVSMIKSGISRLAQLAVDLFLGRPLINNKYIE